MLHTFPHELTWPMFSHLPSSTFPSGVLERFDGHSFDAKKYP